MRLTWVRWSPRLLAVAMFVAAVILVLTVPHPGGMSCLVSPWTYWYHPHPNLAGTIPPYAVGRPWDCRFVMWNRWHAAWALGLGGIVLLALTFLRRRPKVLAPGPNSKSLSPSTH